EFGPKGVAFLAVDANRQDSVTQLARLAKTHKLPFPLLKDVGNVVADQFGAVRTPEVFVLDVRRHLRYRGRVDDQYGVDYAPPKPTRRDLALALEELLAGKPVSRPVTRPAGCLIGRVRLPDAKSEVTYTKHVAAILRRRCTRCH